MRIEELKTPCYVIDEKQLKKNLSILQKVEKDTGCKILLAQKAFSCFYEYPLIGQYLSGTTASGLFEARLGKEECDADFVFVTHYPSKKRPFYAMDDPADPTFTLSFDLLYHGLEITTGGQRIHDYNMLLEKIEKRGMTTEGMEQYMDTFKHGMPPHGGLGIGLERLTMKLIGEDNVRETTLFPRDMSRLEP